MKSGICIKCKGTNVKKLNTHDSIDGYNLDLRLVHFKDPEALFFKGRTYFPMHALVCFGCGYVEFYLNVANGAAETDKGEFASPIDLGIGDEKRP